MPGCEGPQQSHHQGEPASPRQWKKLHISWLEPWSSQRQMPSRPFSGTSDQGKQQVTGNKHSQRQVQVQANALWSQDVTGCLPDEDGPHHGVVPRSDKHPQ